VQPRLSVARAVVLLGFVVQLIGLGNFITTAPDQWLADVRAGKPDRVVGTVALVVLLELLYSAAWGKAWALAASVPLQALLALGYLAFLREGGLGRPVEEWLLGVTVALFGLLAAGFGVVATREARGRAAPVGVLLPGGAVTRQGALVVAVVCLWVGMAVVGLAGGGRAAAGPPLDRVPDATVQLTLTSYAFTPAALEIRAGETTAVLLVNRDAVEHSFDVDALGVHVMVPGRKTALALLAPATVGTLPFRCGEPGHTEAGMVGTLTVR